VFLFVTIKTTTLCNNIWCSDEYSRKQQHYVTIYDVPMNILEKQQHYVTIYDVPMNILEKNNIM
jgi:hypothetical protein